MLRSLVDAGPLVALFDKDDLHHQSVLSFLKEYSGRLYTSWLVIAEVGHLLDFSVRRQIAFLQWIQSGGIEVLDLNRTLLERLTELADKYQDLPMDFADGSLITLAEANNIINILTFDSHFYVLRTKKKHMLTNLLEPYIHKAKKRR